MKDLTGLSITTDNATTLSLYNAAITELCRFVNPVPTAMKMQEHEPDFAMGQVFNGYINLWTTDRDDLQWSEHSVKALAELDTSQLNRRERMHIDVLSEWAKGKLGKAADMLDQILIEYPLDILALQSGHQLDFFIGNSYNLRDRICRVLPSWDKEHPLYGYLLGMLSFGQEEAGQYEAAEYTALMAVNINPSDVWSIHSIAHAREMLNKYHAGAQFMREYEKYWSTGNVMVSHNAIHHGLFLLELGETAEALEYYDTYIHQPNSKPIPMAMVDASSVLWRLYLDGVDVGNRTNALAESWLHKDAQLFYAFNDAHAMAAYVASGNETAALALLERLQDYALNGDSRTSNHAMVTKTGLPVCEGFYAYGRGDYETTIEKLWAIKTTTAQFGGSHAQRDIVARTLLEASIRTGNHKLARALINERIMARPYSPYNLSKLDQVKRMA